MTSAFVRSLESDLSDVLRGISASTGHQRRHQLLRDRRGAGFSVQWHYENSPGFLGGCGCNVTHKGVFLLFCSNYRTCVWY